MTQVAMGAASEGRQRDCEGMALAVPLPVGRNRWLADPANPHVHKIGSSLHAFRSQAAAAVWAGRDAPTVTRVKAVKAEEWRLACLHSLHHLHARGL